MTNYGATTHSRRIARVMFVYGYSEAEALVFMRGWVKGRRAALESYKRYGIRHTRHRIGGPKWERQQDDGATPVGPREA